MARGLKPTLLKTGAARGKSTRQTKQLQSKPTAVFHHALKQTQTQTPATRVTPSVLYQTVDQSVQIVQQVVFGCVSNLAAARSLFRLDCYEPVEYVFQCEKTGDQGSQAESKAKFNGLKRGVSTKVDSLLNLLDTGIADALKKGFLASLHFTIYEQKGRPTEALEQWNLCFVYVTDRHTGARMASGVEITELRQSGKKITVGQAKQSLVRFIQVVTSISYALPDLPASRYMSVEIFYTDDAPQDYRAPNFTEQVIEVSRFPNNEAWEKVCTPVASLDAGHHTVSLSLVYLTNRDPNGDNKLPSGLKCNEEVTKKQSKEIAQPPRRSRSRLSDSIGDLSMAQPAAATAGLTKTIRHEAKDSTVCDPTQLPATNHPLSEHEADDGPLPKKDGNALSLALRSTKEQINGMLQAPKDTSLLEDTQVIGRPSTTQTTERISESRLRFTKAKIQKLDARRDATLGPRLGKPVFASISEFPDHDFEVRCECSHEVEEGDMMLCEFCGKYQHINCYGYLGTNDARIPAVHVCYTCLFAKEPRLLKDIINRVQYRRACYLLRTMAFDGSVELTEALHCTSYFTSLLLKDLRELGLMLPPPGKRGGKTQLSMIVNEITNAQMIRAYFNPRKGIEHYLEPNTTSNVEKQPDVVRAPKRPAEAFKDFMTPRPKKVLGNRASMEYDLTNTITPVRP